MQSTLHPRCPAQLAGSFLTWPQRRGDAGLIIGFPGTLFVVFAGVGTIMGILGIGAAITSVPIAVNAAKEAAVMADDADTGIPAHTELVEVPNEQAADWVASANEQTEVVIADEPEPMSNDVAVEADATPIVAVPEPEPPKSITPKPATSLKYESRTWQDATGSFKVKAVLVSYSRSTVKIKRDDDGREIEVPVNNLSEADQQYINELAR